MSVTDQPRSRNLRPEQKLGRSDLGPWELAFFVVAAAGPLLVVAGFAPLAFLIGGIGAPGAQLVAGGVLFLFAIGFTRMALRVPNPGAFYAYIGRSLGKPAGGGSAILATAAYSAIAIGQLGAVGAFASGTTSRLTGTDIPWPLWSLVALALVVFLGHRRIALSAKVLGVALLAEAGILLVLAVPVLLQGGADGYDVSSFEPSAIFAGGGTGAMFAIVFGAFLGFESTAIYSEETRDPKRTVPRATYLAIGFLAIFYTFMAWVAVIAFGKADVVAVATESPTEMFFIATEQYVGHSAAVVMEILIITSAFASTLAFHNTSSRYLFTLSREGLLPPFLSKIHPRHASPYLASGAQGLLAFVLLVVFIAVGADPYLQVFLLMVAPGILAVIVLQAMTALSIVVHFRRDDRDHGFGTWSTSVAPILSFVGLSVAFWLVVRNVELLSGRTDWVNTVLLASLPIAFVLGMSRTLWLRRTDPARYATLTETRIF